MAATQRIDREDIFAELKNKIEKSPNKEVEVAVTDLANKYGVQGPTMDYHLEQLVKEGKVIISPKKGKYNRKIYKLANENLYAGLGTQDKFKAFIDNALKLKNNPPTQEEPVIEEKTIDPIPDEEHQENIFTQKEEPVEEVKPTQELEPYVEKSLPVQKYNETLMPEESVLTLDDRIQQFISDTNRVYDAHELLKHDDKEILSVMHETIQENIIYLKDLSDQLSMAKSKQLIQNLIDERNRIISENKDLQEQVKSLTSQVEQTKKNFEIDPARVRFMQQILINTMDTYLNLPNSSLALQRGEFREKLNKEIKDLVHYVLKMEK